MNVSTVVSMLLIVCNKAFSQQVSLIRRQRMHIVERHYIFEVCNTAFRQQSGLNIHQRMQSVDIADNRLLFAASQ